MATSVEESWTATNEAIVLAGPFDDFHVIDCLDHELDSSIALFTARSWYFFASSPGFPEIAIGLVTFG